jgi:hypothetical protein
MSDLIVGTIQNYDWPQVRAYAVSLVRSGFTGAKILFTNNITSSARVNLSQLGFNLIDFVCDDRDGFIIRGRFSPVVDFLKANHQNFRYVVWSDIRDVVFQTNPSSWLENNLGNHQLLAAKECWKIRDEGCNDKWAKETVSAEDYVWLREEEACCGGTLAGTSSVMSAFLTGIYEIVSNSSLANDQAALNYLLRVPPFKEVVRVPSMEEGFAVMCAAFHSPTFDSYINPNIPLTDSTPIFDKTSGTIYAPDSYRPFSIVHQYDRDSSWTPIIEDKYLG